MHQGLIVYEPNSRKGVKYKFVPPMSQQDLTVFFDYPYVCLFKKILLPPN